MKDSYSWEALHLYFALYFITNVPCISIQDKKMEWKKVYERTRKILQFNLFLAVWHPSTTILNGKLICWTESSLSMCLLTCSVLYTSRVYFEVLLFFKANWIVSTDNRSSNMSVASIVHFFVAIVFFPARKQKFWRCSRLFRAVEGSFSTPESSLSWSVICLNALGTRIFLVSARGHLFRRAETTSGGGLGPPKFFGTPAGVTNTGNGERGTGNGERGTGNGERGTGNGSLGTSVQR